MPHPLKFGLIIDDTTVRHTPCIHVLCDRPAAPNRGGGDETRPPSGEGGVVDHQQFMRSCCACGVPRMHMQQKPNHVLHLLFTVFTVGIWIPVWVLVGLFQATPQCMTCGEKPGLFGIG